MCLSVVFRETPNLALTSRHFGKIVHGKGAEGWLVAGAWTIIFTLRINMFVGEVGEM